jgi:hypothetical protein
VLLSRALFIVFRNNLGFLPLQGHQQGHDVRPSCSGDKATKHFIVGKDGADEIS